MSWPQYLSSAPGVSTTTYKKHGRAAHGAGGSKAAIFGAFIRPPNQNSIGGPCQVSSRGRARASASTASHQPSHALRPGAAPQSIQQPLALRIEAKKSQHLLAHRRVHGVLAADEFVIGHGAVRQTQRSPAHRRAGSYRQVARAASAARPLHDAVCRKVFRYRPQWTGKTEAFSFKHWIECIPAGCSTSSLYGCGRATHTRSQ